MIDIRAATEGFTLYLQDQPILHHSVKKPCIALGKGSCTVTMPHGMYHIKNEQLFRWTEVSSFSVDVSQAKQGITSIIFTDVLKLEIHENRQSLCLIPIPLLKEESNRFSIQLLLPMGEPIFGCGEQFPHLDLRGKKLPLWVSEPGIGRGHNYVKILANLHSGRGGSQEHTYFPQPSYVSSGGRWVLMDISAFSRFDFKRRGYCKLSCHAIPASLAIGQASSLPEAAGAISSMPGRQKPLPDRVCQGLILGVQGGRSVVEQKLKTAFDAGIRVAALWRHDWQGIRMPPYGKQLFWNWEYDDQLYPELHEQGIKFLGYNNPFLSTDAPLYEEGERKEYFVRRKQTHSPYITNTTTFPVALVDLCNPQACEWYKKIIKDNMLAIGLDGWMADFGEYLPPDGKLYGAMNPYLEHNRYPVHCEELNEQAVQEAGLGNEIVFFCRSGFTGSSNHVPLFRAGDQTVNFLKDNGLPSVVGAGISSALSGVGYWHFDIGGLFLFAWIKRSRELLMRSCELAAFTQVRRTHEGINPKVNAQLNSNPEMLAHFKRVTRIHCGLLPYHREVSHRYQEEGTPRLMPVLTKNNRVAVGQYFYGEDLLVTPIMKKHAKKRLVYLPEGGWIHFFTGREYHEGWHAIRAEFGNIPVFIRSTSPYRGLCRDIAMREGT